MYGAVGGTADLCAQLPQLADEVLASDESTSEGHDARRLFRVSIRRMQGRADLTGDPLIIASVFDSQEKLKEESLCFF